MRWHLPQDEIDQIINKICDYYVILWEEVLSPSRHKEAVEARHHIFYELRKRGMSFSQIGKACNRDYTTVVCAIQRRKEFPDLFVKDIPKLVSKEIVKKIVTNPKDRYLHIVNRPINQGKFYEDYLKDNKKPRV